jgi:subtilisin family serine protease
MDRFGHGTHCSSLISCSNDPINIGVAPESRLFAGKISQMGSMDGFSILSRAITWAADTKEIDIISISFGLSEMDPSLDDLKKAVAYAISKDKIIVAAIGDKEINPMPVYPALLDGCISVGACTSRGKYWDGNADYDKTCIYAPGVDISSYVVKNPYFPEGDTRPYLLSGTSQATAITAGVLGLLVSMLKKKGQPVNSAIVRKIITDHSDKLVFSTKPLLSPLQIFSQF